MIDGIEAATTTALTRALDRTSLQHRTLATNIAHAGTPGFVPLRARFDAQMEASATPPGDAARGVWTSPTQLPVATAATLEPMRNADGSPASVHVDAEVAELGRNAVRYQSLLRALDRHLGILSTAVSDGKR